MISLIIQSILPVKNAFESKHALIWIWNKPATGELKRPFKAGPGLFGMGGGAGGPQTDKVSGEERAQWKVSRLIVFSCLTFIRRRFKRRKRLVVQRRTSKYGPAKGDVEERVAATSVFICIQSLDRTNISNWLKYAF